MRAILLKNGTVIDGLGRAPVRADVLINGDKIAGIGNIPESHDLEIVNCDGLVIAPGFIDVHSHSDKEILQHLPNKILQGVTTEIVGNCGYSLFPTHPNPEGVRLTGEIFDGEPAEGMATTEDYFVAVEEVSSLLNVAALTGHVALRIYVMEMRREVPSPDEMKIMKRVLSSCLETGSIGFSTGLNCLPSSFAGSDELINLCQTLGEHKGIYTTHMRDYKFKVVEAVDEAITVARTADVPLQVSHMQVVGKKNWHRLDLALEKIEEARASGVDVAMDAYPYLAGSCSLIQFLPEWCQAGGIPALLTNLASPGKYKRIAAETDAYMSNTWDDLMVCEVRSTGNRTLIGKSIQRIADERDKPAPETALDLLSEEEGYVYLISFNSSEENLKKVLTHPLTSIITDGMVMEGGTHPRTFGTYPKFLGEYVREKRWMKLEEAIVKSSALAARRFRLDRRGTLENGGWADIVVFDAEKIGTKSDYDNPGQDPEGINHVIINGRFGVRDGELTSEKAGMALRHKAI